MLNTGEAICNAFSTHFYYTFLDGDFSPNFCNNIPVDSGTYSTAVSTGLNGVDETELTLVHGNNNTVVWIVAA